MLELYEEHSIALPYGGLITKILKATLPNILANEHVNILEGPFGKGIPIGHVRAPEWLLTRIVLQNIWPISRNSHVPLD